MREIINNWIEIRKEAHISYEESGKTIDILYSYDRYENNYVSVPVWMILNILKEKGYEIKHINDNSNRG